jgi:hypothetical protein
MLLGMAMLPKDSRQRWESHRGALPMATYARREKGRNYGTQSACAHEGSVSKVEMAAPMALI